MSEYNSIKNSFSDLDTSIGNSRGSTGSIPLEQQRELLIREAKAGALPAQKLLALMYKTGMGPFQKDAKQAVFWYRKAAEQGDAEAQVTLGECYDEGFGVEKDESKAAEWYYKAACQGNARGLCNLGIDYVSGTGCAKDPEKGFQYLTKAAKQGNARAYRCLGLCYENALGTQKDDEKALAAYKKAVELGDKEAQKYIDELQPKVLKARETAEAYRRLHNPTPEEREADRKAAQETARRKEIERAQSKKPELTGIVSLLVSVGAILWAKAVWDQQVEGSAYIILAILLFFSAGIGFGRAGSSLGLRFRTGFLVGSFLSVALLHFGAVEKDYPYAVTIYLVLAGLLVMVFLLSISRKNIRLRVLTRNNTKK